MSQLHETCKTIPTFIPDKFRLNVNLIQLLRDRISEATYHELLYVKEDIESLAGLVLERMGNMERGEEE